MTPSQFIYRWEIPSKSDEGRTHTVGLTKDGKLRCTCSGWTYRHNAENYKPCAHIREAMAMMNNHQRG